MAQKKRAKRGRAAPARDGEKKISASDFVRQQPGDMPVTDVIEAAKKAGLTINANLVYKVRNRDKAKSASKRGSSSSRGEAKGRSGASAGGAGAGAGASESAGGGGRRGGRGGRSGSKAEFIRSFSNDTPAAEIVEAARAQGIKLTVAYVYNARSGHRAPGGEAPRAAGRAARPAPMSGREAAGVDSDERAFFDLVVRVGLTRAGQLLNQVKGRLADMVGGRLELLAPGLGGGEDLAPLAVWGRKPRPAGCVGAKTSPPRPPSPSSWGGGRRNGISRRKYSPPHDGGEG